MGRINDVIQHRDVIIESLPITHNKSSERWKNVSHFFQKLHSSGSSIQAMQTNSPRHSLTLPNHILNPCFHLMNPAVNAFLCYHRICKLAHINSL